MKVKILNVCNNNALPDRGLKADHGNCFCVEIGEKKILFDTGHRGKIFLNNMRALNISPDKIDSIIFSHGHNDHTGGLTAFLSSRTRIEPIEIFLHPAASKPKRFFYLLPIGYPKMSMDQEQKIKLHFVKVPVEVIPGLSTTGEITERPKKDSTAWYMNYKENHKWKRDPLLDDLSLVLNTKEGLVIVTGCCHAGLLNTCAHVKNVFGKEIHAIFGGTHLIMSSKKEISDIGDVLEKTYNTPQLYLNHCTGKKTIAQFEERFGTEVVHDFWAGAEMIYEME